MATILIAAYAATVSTVAVGWQIFTWQRTHTTRLRVEVKNAVLTPAFSRAVTVTAYNESDHDMRATSFGFFANDGSKGTVVCIRPVPGSELPGPVAARDSAAGVQDWNALQFNPALDLSRPVVAFVNANGKTFKSKATQLA